LVRHTFDGLRKGTHNMGGGGLFIACRAILIPLNEYVDVVDDMVRTEYPCNNIPGVRFEERVYLIADSVAVQEQKGDLRLVEFFPWTFLVWQPIDGP
jgi:hypothetical protein